MIQDAPVFTNNPALLRIFELNPFAVLFESYRAVIYGDPVTGPHMPDWVALGWLAAGSVLLIAFGCVVFKRLEPMFAKVL
jgi:ABC-type polysaccharide/polyol phosphate export permease